MRNSQFAYAEALRVAVRDASSWLDLGCGHQFLPEWVSPREHPVVPPGCRVVGVDADAAALRVHPTLRDRIVGTVEQLPLASGAFDLVTANMVVEHVQDPAGLFREVRRVLKPGGVFLFHTPNAQGYTTRLTRVIPPALRPRLAWHLQRREERDVYPTFYRANRLDRLRRLAAEAGLNVASLSTVGSSPQLYRVPVAGALERRFLSLLEGETFSTWRPCIIARLVRAA